MALNKLAFHNVLVQELDAPSATATKLADLVDEGTDDLVTKQDLQDQMTLTEARLRADFRAEINRLLKWMVGIGVIVGGGLIGVLAALVAKL